MKARRLDFRSRQIRNIEKDCAMILLWVLGLVLVPDPGSMLVVLLLGSMLIANLMKFYFKDTSFVYYFWMTLAILPITLFALTGFLWSQHLVPASWINLFGIASIAFSILALLGVVLDLIWRIIILRWDIRVIKDLLKQVPS